MEELIKMRKILLELRKSLGLTQAKMAKKLGITQQAYQSYEAGTNIPSLVTFIKISKMCDVSLDFLVGKSQA